MSAPTEPSHEKQQLEIEKLRLEISQFGNPWYRRWSKEFGPKELVSLAVAITGFLILSRTGIFDARREQLATQANLLKMQDIQIQNKQEELKQLEVTYNLVLGERNAIKELTGEHRSGIAVGVEFGSDIESFRVVIAQFHFSLLGGGPPDILKANRLVELLQLTQKIRHLEVLSVLHLEVGNPEIVEIAKVKNLQQLELVRANLSDAQLSQLGLHPRLIGLRLDKNPIRDLAEINRFSGLARLSLRETKIDDAALTSATTLKHSVTALHLDSTAITDASISEFMKWDSLTYLGIRNTKVTSKGLVQLSEHPKLQTVNIEPERITVEDRDTLIAKNRFSIFQSISLPSDLD